VYALGIIVLSMALGWRGSGLPKCNTDIHTPAITQDTELHTFLSDCLDV
jgi:hypothetical protein